MAHIDIAVGIKGWFAELIAHGTPRSDPLLDMVIDYFRWDAKSADLHKPSIVDWIVKRREDLAFETSLPDLDMGYAGLLAHLRVGISPLNWLREGWRRMVWHRGLTAPYRSPSPFSIFGILFWLYACVWWLLREGYSRRVRILGFGFVGLSLAATALIGLIPSDMFERRSQAMPEITQPVANARFESFDGDVAPVLQMATDGTMGIDTILQKNPPLYNWLKGIWTEERDGGGGPMRPSLRRLTGAYRFIIMRCWWRGAARISSPSPGVMRTACDRGCAAAGRHASTFWKGGCPIPYRARRKSYSES